MLYTTPPFHLAEVAILQPLNFILFFYASLMGTVTSVKWDEGVIYSITHIYIIFTTWNFHQNIKTSFFLFPLCHLPRSIEGIYIYIIA